MYIIPYNNPFRTLWNILMLCGILGFLFLITYRMVFDIFTPDLLYFLLLTVFIVDIYAGFTTTVKHGYLRLEEPDAIRRHYLKTHFLVDVISALPIEIILLFLFDGLGSASSIQGIPLIIQCLTLIKLFKAGRIFNELQETVGFIPAVRRLLFFAYWLVALIHLLALGWILIGAGDQGRPQGDRYLRALYWAITTLSTIGYGDYTPDHDSNGQILYTLIVQLFGVGVFSYVIANVSSLVSNLDVARSAYRNRLDEINAFLHAQHIPSELQERVRDYYSYLWEQQRGVSSSHMLREFPRNLSQEILMFLNREVLDRVELFKDADELFIREAVQLLTPEVFLPGEYIIRQGEYGDCMYFLASGEVRIVINGTDVARLGPGSPFGETALVENVHRNASVLSVYYGTGYRLSKTDFDGLRAKYPDFDKQVRAVVAKRKN